MIGYTYKMEVTVSVLATDDFLDDEREGEVRRAVEKSICEAAYLYLPGSPSGTINRIVLDQVNVEIPAHVTVLLVAMGNDETPRTVQVPRKKWGVDALEESSRMDLVYHYGQNKNQPQECRDVTIGDVIKRNGKLFLVRSNDFIEISREQLREYTALPRDQRASSPLFAV